MPIAISVDDIQVRRQDGSLTRLYDLPKEELLKIYKSHKEGCTDEELDLVLGSDDPIPLDRIHLHVLRRVDRLIMARRWAEEVDPCD